MPVVAIVLLLLSPVFYRQWLLSQVPDIEDPFSVAEVLTPIPEQDNAFPLFEEAHALCVEVAETDSEEYWQQRDELWHPAHAQLNKYLELNRAALGNWREATEKNDCQFVPITGIERATPPALYGRREMILWCRTEIGRLTKTGQPADALPWLRASFRFSRLITRNGTGLDRRLGDAFFAISTESAQMWMEHPEVTADELRDLLRVVRDSARLTEKPSIHFKLGHVIAQREWAAWSYDEMRREYKEALMTPPLGSRLEAWLRAEPEFSRRLAAQLTANHLQFIDAPRRERPPVLEGDVFDDSHVRVSPGRLTARELLKEIGRSAFIGRRGRSPLLAGFVEDIDSIQALDACLQVALAAQAYHRDHGEFPGGLADLQPDYLAELPDDPYAPESAPVVYRRTADEAVVYSRFENAVDDRGTMVTFEEAGYREPPDFGIRIRPPGDRRVVAPRP